MFRSSYGHSIFITKSSLKEQTANKTKVLKKKPQKIQLYNAIVAEIDLRKIWNSSIIWSELCWIIYCWYGNVSEEMSNLTTSDQQPNCPHFTASIRDVRFGHKIESDLLQMGQILYILACLAKMYLNWS